MLKSIQKNFQILFSQLVPYCYSLHEWKCGEKRGGRLRKKVFFFLKSIFASNALGRLKCISQIMLSPTISMEGVDSRRAVGGEVGTIGLEDWWGFRFNSPREDAVDDAQVCRLVVCVIAGGEGKLPPQAVLRYYFCLSTPEWKPGVKQLCVSQLSWSWWLWPRSLRLISIGIITVTMPMEMSYRLSRVAGWEALPAAGSYSVLIGCGLGQVLSLAPQHPAVITMT